MDDDHNGLDTLDIERIIGFNGAVPSGLQVHPDSKNLVYPLGCNIIIQDISTCKQSILSKHTNNVTCIAIDPLGRYIATGQVNYMGFKAPMILWDYESKQPIMEKELHKVKVQALAFSADSSYLISLGGRDCGAVVVWHLGKGEALCGSQAQVESAGITNCLAASLADRNVFITGGNNTLRVWQLDAPNRKIWPTDVKLGGGLKRSVICIEMVDHKSDHPYMFCGTSTGDILGVNIRSYQMQFVVPGKDKFSLGVTAISIVNYHDSMYDFLIGTGDGLVGKYQLKVAMDKRHHVIATWKHNGTKPWQDPKLKRRSAVTSIAKRGTGHMFFIGTEHCQIYRFNYSEMIATLLKTCHSSPVNDVIFAFGYSELLATCAFEEIRIWHTLTGQELCRYTVSNMTCNAICITRDGRSIFSAWDDGKIRVIGFKREKDGTSKLFEKYTVRDTHNKGVTAIAITTCGTRLITGGGEGQVRVWQIYEDHIVSRSRGDLVANMKEHKGKVTSIQIHPNDRSAVSASTDGSTIIWDLETNTRSQIVLANTLFKCVCFGAKGVHILTSGTDHKIGYWEVQDGSALRELEGSKTGAINTMDISSDGNYYITGGEDRLLKLWKYNEGQVTHVGIGHSAQITKARICPNRKLIVSCSADGAVHIWKFPNVL
ncbi:cilia- and flagella-associated protein 52-like [Littorina saxatilis]|uniref:Cilia- and flagella-associated protein 52 n=1 Tax=Littorina saxatilis TaxID=31220 RepID=A0AAN9BYM5_9CAEN